MYKGNTGVALKGISSAARVMNGEIGWDEAVADVAGAYVKGAVVDTASTAVISSVGSAVTSTAAGSALVGTAAGAAIAAAAPIAVPLAIGAFIFSIFDD